MVEKILSRSVRLMFASGVVMGAGMLAQPAFAQDTAPQRVEILGSSIKRIAVEGALPVQTLSKAQIEQSGATTAADLIASLPSMQGFVSSSASVNGLGAGTQTASIHGIGDGYTLVLLNGRRVAPFTTGSTVNLATIPLSAIERVEILTDGASALYGSDAIAGVVNFVLKKNQKDFNVEFTYSTPQESSKGKTTNFAISKGFGDLNKDGYNVFLAYSHDEQAELNAADREFTKFGGQTAFNENGKKYIMTMTSGNSTPGNVTAKRADGTSLNFNPYLAINGNCPALNTVQAGTRCRFDYAQTVQILPELKRDSLMGTINYQINDDLKFYAEGLATKFTSTAAFAAPAQPLGLPLTGKAWASALAGYNKLNTSTSPVASATMNLRLVDSGRRTDGWATESKHLATGFEGTFKNWDYAAGYVHSENKAIDNAVAGYTSGEKLDALIASGAFNPFLPPSASQKAALAPAVLRQVLDVQTSTIDVLNLRASTGLFKMSGGEASIGMGVDTMTQKYMTNPSPIAQGPNKQQPAWTDTNVGGGTGALPVDASRQSWGGFTELQMPVLKNLDVNFAARYDSYDAVKNSKNFDDQGNLRANATQGEKASSGTYKLSAAFRPTESTLIRGSYGTGFKAPSLNNITSPIVNGGSSNFYACPIKSGPLLTLCNGNAEYGLLTGGNSTTGSTALKPEKSKQWTVGFRIEPTASLSVGFDMWEVKLKDQISNLPQSLVFNDPKYLPLFSAYFDPIQKQNVLVATLSPFNLASSQYQGIDWDHTYRMNTSVGKVSVNWTGTYMLKADSDTGVKGEPTEKSVGRFNKYNDVTFRVISRLAAIWKPSDRYTHSATLGYHSSYTDQVIDADNDGSLALRNDNGTAGDAVSLTRTVKAYYTVDLQSKVLFSKNLTITGGIKNLFNQDPPVSIRNAGGGNHLGIDGRYTDPLGRQFYVVGNLKF
nr:TonB-dependent receptor [uncultured Undibacterium sp.]